MTDQIHTAEQALEAAATEVNLAGLRGMKLEHRKAAEARIRALATRIPPLDAEVAGVVNDLCKPWGIVENCHAQMAKAAVLLIRLSRELAALRSELNSKTFTVDEGLEWQARAEKAEAEAAALRAIGGNND